MASSNERRICNLDEKSLVRLPSGRKPIGCKWIVKTKQNADGTIQNLKARLVTKGFLKQEGFDFMETFSLVEKPTTIKVVLTLALVKGWLIGSQTQESRK